ncbi:MAG: hypothetical protein L6R39_005330 [Caloplaca ligustica]|nr:MAG: hypothetical protein L6R39_005330 [Caloplaca ligustica]
MTNSAVRNIKVFKELCGQDALKKVTLATTMWDCLKRPQEGEDREQQLKREYWRDMISLGSTVHRHDNTAKSAKRLIRLLAEKGSGVPLNLQKQLVDERRSLNETPAGMLVENRQAEQFARLAKDLKAVKEEEKQAWRMRDRATAEALQKVQDGFATEMNNMRKELRRLQFTANELHEESMRNIQRKRDHQAQVLDKERQMDGAERDRLRGETAKAEWRAQETERRGPERRVEEKPKVQQPAQKTERQRAEHRTGEKPKEQQPAQEAKRQGADLNKEGKAREQQRPQEPKRREEKAKRQQHPQETKRQGVQHIKEGRAKEQQRPQEPVRRDPKAKVQQHPQEAKRQGGERSKEGKFKEQQRPQEAERREEKTKEQHRAQEAERREAERRREERAKRQKLAQQAEQRAAEHRREEKAKEQRRLQEAKRQETKRCREEKILEQERLRRIGLAFPRTRNLHTS